MNINLKDTNLKNKQCALDMTFYGLLVIVQTTRENILSTIHEFATQPDEKFGGGFGKDALLEYLGQSLVMEDDFFNESGFHQLEYPGRWKDYLDNCVVFACLHSYLNGLDLPFLDERSIWEQVRVIEKILGNPKAANEHSFLADGTD